MTSLIRVFDADTIFLIPFMPFWHSFIPTISLIKFPWLVLMILWRQILWTFKNSIDSNVDLWLVGVCTPCLLPFPTLYDETTQKRQAYVQVSLLAKTINCHAWSIHESHELLQCPFSTRCWLRSNRNKLSELIIADANGDLSNCFL